MDELSKLYGWLTGKWTHQSPISRTLLGCALLLVMACVCGLPLLLLNLMEP